MRHKIWSSLREVSAVEYGLLGTCGFVFGLVAALTMPLTALTPPNDRWMSFALANVVVWLLLHWVIHGGVKKVFIRFSELERAIVERDD
jgi:hypothetical protein